MGLISRVSSRTYRFFSESLTNKKMPEEIDFPFGISQEETFLIGSYTKLINAQDSIKKFKEYKKVQIKELAEKKQQRLAAKSGNITLSRRKTSKDLDEPQIKKSSSPVR